MSTKEDMKFFIVQNAETGKLYPMVSEVSAEDVAQQFADDSQAEPGMRVVIFVHEVSSIHKFQFTRQRPRADVHRIPDEAAEAERRRLDGEAPCAHHHTVPVDLCDPRVTLFNEKDRAAVEAERRRRKGQGGVSA
jgi:hypothetical protein